MDTFLFALFILASIVVGLTGLVVVIAAGVWLIGRFFGFVEWLGNGTFNFLDRLF
jgi:hypothetical protein